MMRYIKVGRHSGEIISAAIKGNFVGIMNGTEKRLIKLNGPKIDTNKVYDLKIMPDGTANIKVVTNAWACSKQDYDAIMHDGETIINRIFGDLI